MVRFINAGIGIEARIDHDSINQVVDDACDV